MTQSKRPELDWQSEQVWIALAKVNNTLSELRSRNDPLIHQKAVIEKVFAEYTGIYRSYKVIMKHLHKFKRR